MGFHVFGFLAIFHPIIPWDPYWLYLAYFEGVCFFNYRHPGPRREWNPGPNQPAVDHFRKIRQIPADPLDPPLNS